MESSDSESTNEKGKKQCEGSISENLDNHVNSMDIDVDSLEGNDSEQTIRNNAERNEVSGIDVPCETSEKPVSSVLESKSNDSGESLVMQIDTSGCSDENGSEASEWNLSIGEESGDDISDTVNRLINMVESKQDTSSKTAVTDSLNCPTFPIAANVDSEKERSEDERAEGNACKVDEAAACSLKNRSDLSAMESIVNEHELISSDPMDSETNENSFNQLTEKKDCDEQKSEAVQKAKTGICIENNSTESDVDVCGEDDAVVSVESDGDNCTEFLLETENKTKSESVENGDITSFNKDQGYLVESKSHLSGTALTKKSELNNIHDEYKPIDSNEPLDMSIMQGEGVKLDVGNALQTSTQQCCSNISSCSNFEQEQSCPKESVMNVKDLQKVSSDSLSNEETGFPEFLKDHVTIGRYDPVMGDFTLKSNEALIDCPSYVAPFLVKEPDVFPPSESKSRDNNGFFNSSVGNFLIGIGFSRVREWYHHDMTRIKSRRIKKSGRTDELIQELKNHQTHFLQAKKANEHFALSYKKCRICDYVTESSIALEGHMLAPHVTSRREYVCGYCSYLHRDPKDMLNHMKDSHNKIGHIDPPLASYECYCCIFETNSRVKLNTHLGRCLKYFNHSRNQCPMKDIEFPCLTPKPITVSIVKSYEKSISSVMPSRGRPKKNDNIIDYFNPQSNFYSGQSFTSNHGQFRPGMNMPLSDGVHNQLTSRTDHMYPHANNAFGTGLSPLHHLGNNHLQGMNSLSSMSNSPSIQYPYVAPKKAKKSFNSNPFGNSSLLGGMHQFGKELPPGMPQPPRLQGPYPTPMNRDLMSPNVPHHPHNLVVCEICDGYIKDLEQLRTHMQLIHKVKIHPKMLSSRPPLNCQKCLWRFFTDHGLERHLLGSHGLVTSNMQELANNNKDTGCCTICGRVYASKLVAHMNQVHKIALKPAHLSYKCTVCSATFGLYRLFENHVYLVHAGGTKRPSSEYSPVPKKSLKLHNFEKN